MLPSSSKPLNHHVWSCLSRGIGARWVLFTELCSMTAGKHVESPLYILYAQLCLLTRRWLWLVCVCDIILMSLWMSWCWVCIYADDAPFFGHIFSLYASTVWRSQLSPRGRVLHLFTSEHFYRGVISPFSFIYIYIYV